MYIRRVEGYDTQANMSEVRALYHKADTMFLSGWVKSSKVFNVDRKLIKDSVDDMDDINRYLHGEKPAVAISNYLKRKDVNVSKENISVCSNGTLGMFMALLEMKEIMRKSVLIIGPIYFSYYNILKKWECSVYNCYIDFFNIDISGLVDDVEDFIDENGIECVVLTQPYFGVGQNMKMADKKRLIQGCSERDVLLIFDSVYGNMDWDYSGNLADCDLITEVVKHKKCLLVESVTKNFFLNGIKSAVIYGSTELISSIRENEFFYSGTITYAQNNLLYNFFQPENEAYLLDFMATNLKYIKRNYVIASEILGTFDCDAVKLASIESGYFCLAGIDKSLFCSKADNEIAEEIFSETKILTLPHSRYNYGSDDFYIFRINLSLDSNELKKAMYNLHDMLERKMRDA